VTSSEGDLVVVALPGVQRLISEAQSTADVHAGSQIVANLAAVAAKRIREQGAELVIPATVEAKGMPNRVVALAARGRGADLARHAAEAVSEQWRGYLTKVFRFQAPPPTPGIPTVLWVCVPDEGQGYPAQWARAQALLAARRRVRDFDHQEWQGREICTLSPRWPAEEVIPANLKEHERATLSAANWVRRRWQDLQSQTERFPSTPSIASAPFRRDVLRLAQSNEKSARDISSAISDLHEAARAVEDSHRESRVPGLPEGSTPATTWFSRSGGPWVYPERWQVRTLARNTDREERTLRPSVHAGRAALKRLIELVRRHSLSPPRNYLAIIVQDLDSMGRFLAGEGKNAAGAVLDVHPQRHREISELLSSLSGRQTQQLRSGDLLGVPVYAGGDDLLAFAPARTALAAAQACHDGLPSELPTASTGVVFFHYHAGLQAALTHARQLLDRAKEAVPRKHALAVGYLRRSGVSDTSIHPWSLPSGRSAAAALQVFARSATYPLSPRLVADLERDHTELATLHQRKPQMHQAELLRLVRRHLGGMVDGQADAALEVTSALLQLGGEDMTNLLHAARIGVFLRQEAS
jgi:hypothetical protein